MRVNQEWISISDMMSGLMMVFLFIAVVFMNEIQKEQAVIKEFAEEYQTIQRQLNIDLNNEFRDDLVKWDAEILRDNTIRFRAPDILFASSSSDIKPNFKEILNDFFPRYLSILTSDIYKDNIQEIRVEGHTSSTWQSAKSREASYLNNMLLSQDRARNVLAYIYGETSSTTDRRWLEKHLRANGMSFSRLIIKDGQEDVSSSQRVEFRVMTKAEEKIYQIIDKLQKT